MTRTLSVALLIFSAALLPSCVRAEATESGQNSNDPDATQTPAAMPHEIFSGTLALRHVYAQAAFGPRPPGSDALLATGDYILAELTRMGWTVAEQHFEYRGVTGRNLTARRGEAGAELLLIGAHYDTRPVADNDPLDTSQPVLGANDGASGVAVLLELARVLDVEAVNGEVVLAFFDAEDSGRLNEWDWAVGSDHFAEAMSFRPTAVIIVDMVGDANQEIYFESNSDEALREHLWGIADSLGYSAYFHPEVRYSLMDDHIPFVNQGIPSVDIIDFDYPYWHTADDTVDKISAVSLERVGRLLEVFLENGGVYSSD